MPAMIFKSSLICSLLLVSTQALANKNTETSSLQNNPLYRPNLNAQPNLSKGEVALPVQASIIYVIKQSVSDFLLQVATENNVKLTLSGQVTGVLQKISFPMELEQILPELSKSHGIEWHIQGKHLFVSNSLENTNRLIKLGNMSFVELKEAIDKAELNPGANKMSLVEDKNAVAIIGSVKYIAKVETIFKNYQSAAK